MPSNVDAPDWSTLPAPDDDGAAKHLFGRQMPDLALRATDGSEVNLSRLKGWTIVYAYPRTGRPNMENPPGWDEIPGARGCTPQSCAFRDHFKELQRLGIDHVYGLSTQDTDYQKEAQVRLHLPFALLSDEELHLTQALDFPKFETAGMTLLKRFTLVVRDAEIVHVFYPVFPPDQNAEEVITWLTKNPILR